MLLTSKVPGRFKAVAEHLLAQCRILLFMEDLAVLRSQSRHFSSVLAICVKSKVTRKAHPSTVSSHMAKVYYEQGQGANRGLAPREFSMRDIGAIPRSKKALSSICKITRSGIPDSAVLIQVQEGIDSPIWGC